MEVIISVIKTIAYVCASIALTVSFWLGLMWLVSRDERKPENIKVYQTPEEIEAYVEMSRKERRRLAKARLKATKRAKKHWFHDEDAQRYIDEHPDEVA
jgi:hypothetical protein